MSSSATSTDSIQKGPSPAEVSKAKDALKAALSFNFETMIQPEILAKLQGALDILTSSEGIPNVPQDQLRQFKAALPLLIQDYHRNMTEIQEMKNKQTRFTDLGQALTIAMEKMEGFQHQKAQLSLQKDNGLKKIKEIQDNIILMQQQVVQLQTEDASHDEKMQKVIQEEEEIAGATHPLVEEHDVLNSEIPHVENRIEALVTNLSTSTVPWDKFKADVLEKM
jgi:chromosome segregation ATPase